MIDDKEDTCHQILHIDIGFALFTITKHLQLCRILLQLMDEVIDHAVCKALTHHIRETRDPGLDVIRGTESTDESLTRQLTSAIVRHRFQRSIILVQHLIGLAIDGRSRGKEEFLYPKFLEQLQDLERGIKRQVVINQRVLTTFLDVTIGSQMIDHLKLSLLKDAMDRRCIQDIHLLEAEIRMSQQVGDILLPTQYQIIYDRYVMTSRNKGIIQMRADKTSSACY